MGQITSTPFDTFDLPSLAGEAGKAITVNQSEDGFEYATAASDWAALQDSRFPFHYDGMTGGFLFNEGSGERARNIRDATGNTDMVFDAAYQAAKNSDPEWTSFGLRLTNDIVETQGAIQGVHSLAVLYRAPFAADGGFIFTGVNSNSSGNNRGVQLGDAQYNNNYIGGGQGVAPLISHTDGQAAYRGTRGGWVLYFMNSNQAYNRVMALGGRRDNQGNRPADLEVAGFWTWNKALSDAERQEHYEGVRQMARERSLYLDWRDQSNQVDCVIIMGQSNAMGRTEISGLSAADQAQQFFHTFIQQGNSGNIANHYASPELLRLGVNQQWDDPANDFGPELGLARRREADNQNRVRPLYIAKSAIGASALNVGATPSWSANAPQHVGYMNKALSNWFAMEQRLLGQGLGPRLRAVYWVHGLDDSSNATYAAEYQTELQAFWDAVKNYTGYATGVQFILSRLSSGMTGQAHLATIRAAQDAFGAANTDATVIDTDSFSLQGDLLHYDAAGMIALGHALYDATDFV